MNDYSGAHVLVTGGAGFLGKHLSQRLQEFGAQVVVVDRGLSSGAASTSKPDSSTLLKLDLTEASSFEVLREERFDYAFHLAGNAHVSDSVERPEVDFDLNLRTTLNLLQFLRRRRKAPRLVLASSAAVYGNPPGLPINELSSTNPISPYGVSKLASEKYVAVFSACYGLPGASLRIFSAYGPGLRKQVVYDVMKKLGQKPDSVALFGTGEETRDFVYVDDVIRAFLVVAARGVLGGEPYNVASGEEVSIRKLGEQIRRAMQSPSIVEFSGEARPGDPTRWVGDSSTLRRLGWEPTIPLADGLKLTANWFSNENS